MPLPVNVLPQAPVGAAHIVLPLPCGIRRPALGTEAPRVVLHVALWCDGAVPLHHRLMTVSAAIWSLGTLLPYRRRYLLGLRYLGESHHRLKIAVAHHPGLDYIGGGCGAGVIEAAAGGEGILCAFPSYRALLAHCDGGADSGGVRGVRVDECGVFGFMAGGLSGHVRLLKRVVGVVPAYFCRLDPMYQ